MTNILRSLLMIIDYSVMTTEKFVMMDRADNGIDGVKFVASAAAPNILTFFHAELGTRGMRSEAGNFLCVAAGRERADLAVVSALSLPGILTWLGIQHRTVFFEK